MLPVNENFSQGGVNMKTGTRLPCLGDYGIYSGPTGEIES